MQKVSKKEDKIFTPKYIASLCICIVVTLVINLWVVGLAVVVGPSMLPTLDSGDIVVVNKLSSEYEQFDIVIVKTTDIKIIKRVIGTPGDTIQIREGKIYINNEKINDVVDDYIDFAGTAFEPITLGKDEYFLIGDNRNNSQDSRYEDIGVINANQIEGKVLFSLIALTHL